MRCAVFGDIHGNLPAFEAVLKDIRAMLPDALLCLGDVAADGAWPRECIHLLDSLNCPVVLGNADEDMLRLRPFEARGFPEERFRFLEKIQVKCYTGPHAEVLTSYDRCADFGLMP